MNTQETARLILGLRSKGWSEDEINDFMHFIKSGEEQHKPKAADKINQRLYISENQR